jgi:hypothetical protein
MPPRPESLFTVPGSLNNLPTLEALLGLLDRPVAEKKEKKKEKEKEKDLGFMSLF